MIALMAAAVATAEIDLAAQRTGTDGVRMKLTATAYCQPGKTAAGTKTHAGIVAADPRVLPVGTVLRIIAPDGYAGIYTVMDTGGRIKGRDLDIFMPSCARAEEFGRRSVEARVLRRGWDPKSNRE
ncbi:MAG: 3D domain-containing protein [Bradyrhizobium sp.]